MSPKSFLILFFIAVNTIFSQENLTTIPQVQQWKYVNAQINYDCVTIKNTQKLTNKQQLLLNRFKKELKDIGVTVKNKPSKSSLNLVFNTNYTNISNKKNAYKIQLAKKTTIEASSYEALVFSTRTLLQLLSQKKYINAMPKGEIIDFPSYDKRMLLLDVARKFYTIKELKDFIKAMAWVKMNELHLHLSDNSWGGYSAYRLESEKYPDLTAKDGHYSWKEIRNLQDFAYSYGITIIPEIDSPGHSLAFTKIRPDLKSNWLAPKYLDITNKDMYPFIEEILDEVIPHFDAPDFHLGTDEYRINRIKDDSLKTHIGETFRKYINHFNKVVRKHGKTTRIWSGFEHMPGTTEIDSNITIDMWETSDAKDKSSKGYNMINSSHFYTYIVPGAPYYGVSDTFIYEKWTPEIFSNKTEQNLEKGSPGLMGSKIHIWSDYGPSGYSIEEIARLSIPSMMVFSEKMWGTKAYDSLSDFKKILNNLMDIPLTTFLDRNVSNEKILFSTKSSIDLNSKSVKKIRSKKKNAEYPWTLDLIAKRTHLSQANEVLLSSRFATVYTELEHTFKSKKNKKNVEETKCGFAIVRANQTEGTTPLTSYKPDIIIFDYTFPLNESVKITLKGERKKTSLFVNDKLVSSKNIQMLCPLEYIGSEKEGVFKGIIESLEVKELAVTKSISN